jgi:hypothetical protein
MKPKDKMKRYFLGILILILFIIFTVSPALAQVPEIGIKQPQGTGIQAPDAAGAEGMLEIIVRNTIIIIFSFGGIATLFMFVWGAFTWITSEGDKEKVQKSRQKMTYAVIGLALLSLSFVIINAVGQIVGFNPLGKLTIPRIWEAPAGSTQTPSRFGPTRIPTQGTQQPPFGAGGTPQQNNQTSPFGPGGTVPQTNQQNPFGTR